MKRTLSIGFILLTLTVLAAVPASAQAAEEGPEAAPACVEDAPALGADPLAEAVPQALCHVRADCPTGGPVSCSGASCVGLDSCYAWCDGVYYWCAPPPGIYCPPVS